jgi:hypothetical protein
VVAVPADPLQENSICLEGLSYDAALILERIADRVRQQKALTGDCLKWRYGTEERMSVEITGQRGSSVMDPKDETGTWP